jgi:hypothetical protein
MLYSSLIDTIGNTLLVRASPRPVGHPSPEGRRDQGNDVDSKGTISSRTQVLR